MPSTMAGKIWDQHVVRSSPGEPDLLYIDLHLVHEVTSPQAFESMRLNGRRVRRPDLTIATVDHNNPTRGGYEAADEISRRQMDALKANCEWAGVKLYGLGSRRQGIVHVIGPELGLTHPGKTIVCGDSHTSTHGAFGDLAFGIGSSEVEHVLSTQCLWQRRPQDMAVDVEGALPLGVTAKDLVLGLIARVGIAAGSGSAVEYRGAAIRALSMEGRMTVCNMSIEWGARVGMVAPDDITFAFLEGRPSAPSGAEWEAALDRWRALPSDPGAECGAAIALDATTLEPYVTWAPTRGRRPPSRDGCRSRQTRPPSGSSAPAPTPGSRTCAWRPRWSRASACTPGCGRWWCRGRRRSSWLPKPRAWTASSRPRASSGGTPAARCAWA